MDTLTGSAVPSLEDSLRFRAARQGFLAANLANVDTPGYRRVDLRFDSALDRSRARLVRTHAGHKDGNASNGHRIETGPRPSRPDGNGIDLDREVVTASRNAGAFLQHSTVLSRLLAMRRIALTGETS